MDNHMETNMVDVNNFSTQFSVLVLLLQKRMPEGMTISRRHDACLDVIDGKSGERVASFYMKRRYGFDRTDVFAASGKFFPNRKVGRGRYTSEVWRKSAGALVDFAVPFLRSFSPVELIDEQEREFWYKHQRPYRGPSRDSNISAGLHHYEKWALMAYRAGYRTGDIEADNVAEQMNRAYEEHLSLELYRWMVENSFRMDRVLAMRGAAQ